MASAHACKRLTRGRVERGKRLAGGSRDALTVDQQERSPSRSTVRVAAETESAEAIASAGPVPGEQSIGITGRILSLDSAFVLSRLPIAR
jgi:hypothetical protein